MEPCEAFGIQWENGTQWTGNETKGRHEAQGGHAVTLTETQGIQNNGPKIPFLVTKQGKDDR